MARPQHFGAEAKPLLALVDGPAYAGGMGLAGICDVVLATPRASFALPEVRIVAISADDSQGSQYDMMRAGAVGFVTKGSSDDEILRVIRSSARW